MIFITLARLRKKPTKELMSESSKLAEKMAKEGIKILSMYWTLGRYDAIMITEGKDEKTAMKALIRWGDIASMETLIAIPREGAVKLLE